MKYKSYGDKNTIFSTGLDLELIEATDDDSARNANRPVGNIYENQEEIYKLLNTLLKTTYGNKYQNIIPDIFESFSSNGFCIGNFESVDNYYLRMPTGAALLTSNKINKNLDKYTDNDPEYIDAMNESGFSDDGFRSYAYVNRPNINLLERQLSSFMDINLNDSYNDLKVIAEEIPTSYLLYFDNSIDHLKNNKYESLFVCKKDFALYAVESSYVSKDETIVKDKDGKKTETIFKYYCSPETKLIDINEISQDKEYIYLTNKLLDSEHPLDANGNPKKSLGYHVECLKSNFNGIDEFNFPNKKEEANLKIEITDAFRSKEYNLFSLSIQIDDQLIKNINVPLPSVPESTSIDNTNIIINGINENNSLSASLYKENNKEYIKIIFLDSYLINYDNSIIKTYFKSSSSKESEVNFIFNSVLPQMYFNNIFEMIHGLKKKNMLSELLNINDDNIFNNLSCETYFKLKHESSTSLETYYIYYDLNCFSKNIYLNRNYDKTGRLLISKEEKSGNNFIKLFSLNIDFSGTIPKIKEITNYIDVLDKRLISTKRGEFQTLKSLYKSDFEGMVDIKGDVSITTGSDDSKKVTVNNSGIDIQTNIAKVKGDVSITTGLDDSKKVTVNNSGIDIQTNIAKVKGDVSITTGLDDSKKVTVNNSGIDIKGDVSITTGLDDSKKVTVNNSGIDIQTNIAKVKGDVSVDGTFKVENGISTCFKVDKTNITFNNTVETTKNIISKSEDELNDNCLVTKSYVDKNLSDHANTTVRPHGATSESQPKTLVFRDENKSFNVDLINCKTVRLNDISSKNNTAVMSIDEFGNFIFGWS